MSGRIRLVVRAVELVVVGRVGRDDAAGIARAVDGEASRRSNDCCVCCWTGSRGGG